MTKKTESQEAHSLISLFEVLYTAKFKRKPTLNRWRDAWGFKSMIADLGFDRSKQVIEYYFQTNRPVKTTESLFRNYDRLDKTMREREEDERERERLRQITKQKVDEWRQRKQK